MRLLILAVLPVAALLAQAPPPSEPAQPKTETPAEAAPPAQAGKPTKLDPAVKAALERKLKEILEQGQGKPTLNLGKGSWVIARRPGQPCAVPLQNTLRAAAAQPSPDPLPVTPGSPGAVPLEEVSKPAPSCDDVKR
jgi:hypothetical protein